MPRVVFDTVIFVRALINPHGHWGRLVFEAYHRYRLYLSEPVAREILEVLQRPELTRKFRRLPALDLGEVLQILGRADLVDVTTIPAVSRDPEDDKVLATARAAAAEYLVTEDEGLLVLHEYAGTQILNAATFLSILEREGSSD